MTARATFKQPTIVIARSEATKKSMEPKSKCGLLRSLAMTMEYESAFSRRDAPELCQNSLSLRSEGAGNAGRPMRPQPGRAEKQAMPVTVTTVTPENPAFPAQWFYGLFRALPGDRAFLPPSLKRDNSRENLTPASGCQDHTTSPSASGAVRQ